MLMGFRINVWLVFVHFKLMFGGNRIELLINRAERWLGGWWELGKMFDSVPIDN